jgi:hypothetical protein
MQQQPLRVVMSRVGGDADGDVHGVILKQPLVGDGFQIFLEDGRCMRTSAVKHVAREGDEIVIETANSTYRLQPDPDPN